MFIPIRTDTPLRRTPYMNYALILANLVAFIVQQMVHPRTLIEPFLLNPRDPLLYQFFTYQFLHGSALHIIGNMPFLYIFATNVNDKHGNCGYLGSYPACGAFGVVEPVRIS